MLATSGWVNGNEQRADMPEEGRYLDCRLWIREALQGLQGYSMARV
jgi:hypothetical protein